jgi:hypothetical protein
MDRSIKIWIWLERRHIAMETAIDGSVKSHQGVFPWKPLKEDLKG